MYNSDLSQKEDEWLSLFFKIETPYSDIIKTQILHAVISREYTKYYLFLNFQVPNSIRKLPRFSNRIPIEMLIQHIENSDDEDGIIYISRGEDDWSMKVIKSKDNREPTSFLMHVFDGAIQQIEIYNLDSSEIEINQICLGRVDYRISQDFLFKSN